MTTASDVRISCSTPAVTAAGCWCSGMDGELPALPAATLIRGRASEALDLLPAESVRTVVTSPPYWSLRDYDIEDPFGRNDTLGDYVANIVADFRKLRRVLKGDGTIWLNIGDAYTSGNRRYRVRAPDRASHERMNDRESLKAHIDTAQIPASGLTGASRSSGSPLLAIRSTGTPSLSSTVTSSDAAGSCAYRR